MRDLSPSAADLRQRKWWLVLVHGRVARTRRYGGRERVREYDLQDLCWEHGDRRFQTLRTSQNFVLPPGNELGDLILLFHEDCQLSGYFLKLCTMFVEPSFPTVQVVPECCVFRRVERFVRIQDFLNIFGKGVISLESSTIVRISRFACAVTVFCSVPTGS